MQVVKFIPRKAIYLMKSKLDVIEGTNESIPTTVKKKPVRQRLPKDLEREVIIDDLSDEEKSCDCCGNQLHQVGESRSEKLEFIPAIRRQLAWPGRDN